MVYRTHSPNLLSILLFKIIFFIVNFLQFFVKLDYFWRRPPDTTLLRLHQRSNAPCLRVWRKLAAINLKNAILDRTPRIHKFFHHFTFWADALAHGRDFSLALLCDLIFKLFQLLIQFITIYLRIFIMLGVRCKILATGWKCIVNARRPIFERKISLFMDCVCWGSFWHHHWIVSPNLGPLWILAKYFNRSISINGAEQMILILVLTFVNSCERPFKMPYFGLFCLSFLLFHFCMQFCYSHSIDHFFFFLF